MKKIIYITIFIGILLFNTGCPLPIEDLRNKSFVTNEYFSYYSENDTFKVGDTLWLTFSFPQNLKNSDFDILINENTLICDLSPLLNKLNFNSDSVIKTFSIVDEFSLFSKKGSTIDKTSNFTFVFDSSNNIYLNEFGFILQDTGKFFVAQNNNKDDEFRFIINGVLPNISKNAKDSKVSATFYSTFKNTNSGWIQFYVKP